VEDVERRLIDARTTIGSYYNQAGFIVEAKECVEPIVTLALEQDYTRRISEIYSILGFHSNWVEEDIPKAIGYLEKALEIAEESGDRVSLVMANQGVALALRCDGQLDRALSCTEKALAVNVEANSLWGISVMKSMVAGIQAERGKMDLAYGIGAETVQIAEESGDTYSKAYAYHHHGVACYGKGFLEEAVEYLSQAIGLWERLDLFSMGGNAHLWLGETHFAMGEYQESQDCYDKGALLFERARHGPSHRYECKVGSDMAKASEMLTARETIDRHAQAAVVGKTDVAMADIAPEAMSSLGAFAKKMGPVQPKGYEILGEADDGEHKVFRVKYSHETGSVTVESTWALKGEAWKVIKVIVL